jgi:hypothetical protein
MRFFALTLLSTAGLLSTASAFAESSSALLGCWRAQQTQITRADGSTSVSNGDCVVAYSKTQASSRCQAEGVNADNISRIDAIDASTLRLTLVEAPAGQPKGGKYEVRYQVDGDWLLIERRFHGAIGRQPASLRSVSIREPDASVGTQHCQPRGRSPLRIGRTPVSSLKFHAPNGWQPWLVDPSVHPTIGPAVGPTFMIGAFVPAGLAPDGSAPSGFVLVLDDTRPGPVPVTPGRFLEVKQTLLKELPAEAIRCNEVDRICAAMRPAENGGTYMELLNVKGRVAMVMATSSIHSPSALQIQAQPFVAQLRSDNR